MMRYRKKPVVVEAEQFWPDKKPWPEGVTQAGEIFRLWGSARKYWLPVTPGDWILTGANGKRHPCNPDIFEATYEKVEP